MKTSYCPNCNKELDAATSTDGSEIKPEPNDYSICIYCGSINKFNTDLDLDKVNPLQLASLRISDPPLLEHLLEVSNYIKERAKE